MEPGNNGSRAWRESGASVWVALNRDPLNSLTCVVSDALRVLMFVSLESPLLRKRRNVGLGFKAAYIEIPALPLSE